MQLTNAASFSASSFGSLLLPQRGQTAEGATIWGFTVEQLSASGGELMLIPALVRPLSAIGLRERLLQAAQQESAQRAEAPAPSLRAADGQPLAKVRKAVAPQPTVEPDRKAGSLASLVQAVDQVSGGDLPASAAGAESPRRERKSSKRATPALPPMVQPQPAAVIKEQQLLRAALNNLLESGASETEIHQLFRGFSHLRGQAGLAAQGAFGAEFLVAVFESLPALRDAPDDRRNIGRALGRIRGAGGHLGPASLQQVRRALEFLATAGTVAPDLVAQLLLNANTTGAREKVKKRGVAQREEAQELTPLRPRNQWTKNSGAHGFAQPLVTMFTAQSQAATVDAVQLISWAHWLGRMFAQDRFSPTGETLFKAASATLGKEAHLIGQLNAAFDEGAAGRALATAPAQEASDSEETESDEGVTYEEVESSGTVGVPGSEAALPPLIPRGSRLALSSSSSSSSSFRSSSN